MVSRMLSLTSSLFDACALLMSFAISYHRLRIVGAGRVRYRPVLGGRTDLLEHEPLAAQTGDLNDDFAAIDADGHKARPAATSEVLGADADDCELLPTVVTLHDATELPVPLLLRVADIARVESDMDVPVGAHSCEVPHVDAICVVCVELSAIAQRGEAERHRRLGLRRRRLDRLPARALVVVGGEVDAASHCEDEQSRWDDREAPTFSSPPLTILPSRSSTRTSPIVAISGLWVTRMIVWLPSRSSLRRSRTIFPFFL